MVDVDKIATMQVLVVLGGIVLATFSVCATATQDTPVLFDVTTIYRLDEPLRVSHYDEFSHLADLNHPGVVEVHARTNARGLPFVMRNESVISPNVGVDLPECSMTPGTSLYQLNNYTISHITSITSPGRSTEYNYKYEVKKNEPLSTLKPCFDGSLQLDLSVTENSSDMGRSELLVFLVTRRQNIHSPSIVYILRFTYASDSCYLYKCISSLFESEGVIEDKLFDATEVPNGCEQVKGPTKYPWHFTRDDRVSINMEMSGSSAVVTIASSRQAATKVFDWDGLDPMRSISYFAIGTKLFSSMVTAKSVGNTPGLVLTQPTGSVVSPLLPLGLERICISLVFYAEKEVDIELSLQRDGATSSIGRIQRQVTAEGQWTHRTLVSDLPGASGSDDRLIVMVTKPADSTFVINRLAGCNAAEPEDVLQLPESLVHVTGQGLDVAHTNIYRVSDTNVCTNGGLQVGWIDDVTKDSPLCICPPGFTGNRCSEGCGANSYGADCGGVCSGSQRECRGMVMCKPMMDCDCGPGYKSINCNIECDSGEYGAGCRQRCGRCEGEPCDIYTGLCHQGCEPGYAPPYCKQTLSYPSSPPQAMVLDFYNVSVTGNLKALQGLGVPQFYQIQYKENDTTIWHQETPQPIPEENPKPAHSTVSLGNVTGLEPGTHYVFRVVIIDQTLASYEGDLVPTVNVSTPCIVPGEVDYANVSTSDKYLRTTLVEEDGFEVEWKFPSSNVTWCHVIGYEVLVKMGWRWVTHTLDYDDVTRHHVTDLLPGRQYTVKVRAVTVRGLAAFSKPLVVTTLDRAPDHVVDLKATPIAKRSLKVSWGSPKHPAGTIRHYHVTYQCLHLGACPEINCDDSAGKVVVTSTNHLIEGLIPFAVYNISVAGLSGSMGSVSSALAATSQSEPDVMPASVSPAILSRSNSSLTVQWAAPDNCRGVNGYITGYRYELVPPGPDASMFVGTTPECSVSFDNLSPHAEYVIRVYITTSTGWNSSRPLVITVNTRATSPETVVNLAVYKRGRRMLGLRWSPPRIMSGSLESFTVSHRIAEGSQDPVSETISPTPCPAWSQLFCHTIQGLKQDTDYTIAVKARNAEVNVDGEAVAVNATTRESAPTAPSFLRLLNHTDVAVTVEWGLPDLLHGQLRSFLVNVEETDSYNSSDCCQYFPIREVIVASERASYEFQMTGLKPASSYEVSLSAKTVAMGPAVTLTVHTRPPTPVLGQAPKLAEQAIAGTPLRVRVEPAADLQGDLVSGYLLLLKDNSSDESSSIKDEWLGTQLKQALNGSFTLVAELTQGNMAEGGVVDLTPGQPMVDGVYGTVGLDALKPDTPYQLVLAQVLEYCKALSVGYIMGETFTLKHA